MVIFINVDLQYELVIWILSCNRASSPPAPYGSLAAAAFALSISDITGTNATPYLPAEVGARPEAI